MAGPPRLRYILRRVQTPAPPLTAARHGLELLRRYLLWQTLLYFTPLLLLAVFFHLQYARIVAEGRRVHLETIAEHQARTLDVFLRERVVNLRNLVDSPRFLAEGTSPAYLGEVLERLHRTSDAFVDLGVVDGEGGLVAYVGPVRYTGPVSYREEDWFRRLVHGPASFVFTDGYLGFRGRPHFTIAVRRSLEGGPRVLRAALSPEQIRSYLSSLEGGSETNTALVNANGVYQVVPASLGVPLDRSPFVPPPGPSRGFAQGGEHGLRYAYARLSATPWVLVVPEPVAPAPRGLFAGQRGSILAFTLAFFAVAGLVSLGRAWQMTRRDLAVERHEAELAGQLVQAAKLASVGELAAGIAHEINNPLAIIAEEVGLIQDMQDPVLVSDDDEPLVLDEHLAAIHEAVFRCRDITRKLLTFVRKTDVELRPHDVHGIIDEVIDGMLGNELALANVAVVRELCDEACELVTDRNQFVQVLVNLVKNAIDAMPGGGRLTVRTTREAEALVVSLSDTGCGMTREQLARAFQPFYTTKDPGKGTGLGLSVSEGIIRSLGGGIRVESRPGRGTTFFLELPCEAAA